MAKKKQTKKKATPKKKTAKHDPILDELKKVKKKLETEKEPEEEIKEEPMPVEPEMSKAEESEEKKEEHKEEKHKSGKSDDEKLDIGAKFFIAALILIIVVFGVLFGLKHISAPSRTPTIDEMLNTPITEDTDTKYNYNGFPFILKEGVWNTHVLRRGSNQLYGVQLRHGPKELESITIDGDNPRLLIDSLDANAVYITFDPEGRDLPYVALAVSELGLTLSRALDITPLAACTKNVTDACRDRMIISCPNTEYYTILVKHGSAPKVTVNKNCITLEGTQEDVVKAAERLILKWYGVME